VSEVDEAAAADTESVVEEIEPSSHRGKRWNILAILAFIAGLVVSPLAMPFGYVALGQIRKSDQSGATLAWIAVGLGWLWLASYAVVISAALTIWAENPFWP
jgi:hypothetical protein